jgi:hypothetical protein
MYALLFVAALFVLPLAVWALPFRAMASVRAAMVRGFDRFFAWAFPRR